MSRMRRSFEARRQMRRAPQDDAVLVAAECLPRRRLNTFDAAMLLRGSASDAATFLRSSSSIADFFDFFRMT
jgi:hypothetical protein